MDCKMRDSNDIINMYRKVLILTAAPEEEGSYRIVPGKKSCNCYRGKKKRKHIYICLFLK